MNTITLTLTDDQLMIIRSAMCDKSIKLLAKAFETEEELKKLGREGEEIWEFKQRERVHEIIELIDESR